MNAVVAAAGLRILAITEDLLRGEDLGGLGRVSFMCGAR